MKFDGQIIVLLFFFFFQREVGNVQTTEIPTSLLPVATPTLVVLTKTREVNLAWP
jgi:hypothetical protein